MIFIILLVIAFGMVLGAMQFGSAPSGGVMTTASPRAVLYAQNMETWHQAAMQAMTLDKTAIAADTTCAPATPGAATACDLNQYLRDKTSFALITDKTISPLAKGWPEYQPVVAEGDPTQQSSGGWQSFLVQNINGTSPGTSGSESYVLTVFRGFGYGGTLTTSNISNNKGGLDNTQLVAGLAKTIQDRLGVGNLLCTSTACSFTRAAAYNNAAGATVTDNALGFPVSAFTPLEGIALPGGVTPDQVFNGLPAIMTRVGNVPGVTCPVYSLIWNTSGVSTPGTVTTAANECGATFAKTTAPSNNVTSTAITPYSGYTSSSPTANCQADGTWSMPSPLTCTTSAQPPQPPPNGGCDGAAFSCPGHCCDPVNGTTPVGGGASATCYNSCYDTPVGSVTEQCQNDGSWVITGNYGCN